MNRWLLMGVMGLVLPCGPALAQISPIGAPTPPLLGTTSPLGIGPAAPVPATGIPLGATELTNLGVSPTASGVPSTGPSTSSVSICSGFGSSIPQASLGSSIAVSGMPGLQMMPTMSGMQGSIVPTVPTTFDGGGTLGNASGTCAPGASADFARPAASASSPTGIAAATRVGPVGIPMGSTELGAGGLSPPPVDPTQNLSAPVTTIIPPIVGAGPSITSTGPSVMGMGSPTMNMGQPSARTRPSVSTSTSCQSDTTSGC
ncbi:hypothetical protein DFP91_5290 [Pseudorhodoplanes sinuspersici]|nr:hypothetical protein DFP91_5290 [Pseudorhodoplanes sinuspersici]